MRLRHGRETSNRMKTLDLSRMSLHVYTLLEGRMLKICKEMKLPTPHSHRPNTPRHGPPPQRIQRSCKISRHRELGFATLGVSEEKGRRVWIIFYRT